MSLGLLVSFQLGVATAQAQELPPEAQRHFDAGLALADQRRFDDALREFEAARAIRESAKIVFNVASCFRLSGRPAAAVVAYERVRELGLEWLPVQNREKVERFLAELRPRVTFLTIRPSVASAVIRVNGQEVTRQPHPVDPGTEVTIEASRPGYRAASTTLRPSGPGALAVSLTLEELPPAVRRPPATPEEPAPQSASGQSGSATSQAGALELRAESSEGGAGEAPALFTPAPQRDATPAPDSPATWPWIAAGAAVVAIGAAAAIYFLATPTELEGDLRFTGPR
jgi:hypothetical protein